MIVRSLIGPAVLLALVGVVCCVFQCLFLEKVCEVFDLWEKFFGCVWVEICVTGM